MQYGLSDEELKEVVSVMGQHPEVKSAMLFGSRAMNTSKPTSDVDIALKGNITLDVVSRIKTELEEERPLIYSFDVIDYSTVSNAALKEHIDRFGKVIYAR